MSTCDFVVLFVPIYLFTKLLLSYKFFYIRCFYNVLRKNSLKICPEAPETRADDFFFSKPFIDDKKTTK